LSCAAGQGEEDLARSSGAVGTVVYYYAFTIPPVH